MCLCNLLHITQKTIIFNYLYIKIPILKIFIKYVIAIYLITMLLLLWCFTKPITTIKIKRERKLWLLSIKTSFFAK